MTRYFLDLCQLNKYLAKYGDVFNLSVLLCGALAFLAIFCRLRAKMAAQYSVWLRFKVALC